ncbi:galactose ABC transporter substrate-binding protein [Paenibacillus frigoriresistens]|uniref:galactose ABC transporter substrate-binding protein n=1 Tax=Paenibacillus alginolyticus TaxID=59839 RepID=UPI0015648146|nr:galactose ABC transporter substrate-binding protein [Paenibacillus frigoriresistens]NRF95094.1 galactose ABC transporter substrate-binding protein [Paenibacillus frigoriresistens]
MKKQVICLLFAGVLAATAGCSQMEHSGQSLTGAATGSRTTKSIGFLVYNFGDTYITQVRNFFAQAAGSQASVDFKDSQNSQQIQNENIELFINKKVDALVVNPVDRTATSIIIDKAKNANIPVIFFNREPLSDDMKKWDKVYYVGAKAEQSGAMAGEILADYFKNHPEADKNKDGTMQYVMLKGEPGHQDAEIRTKYSVKAVVDAGIKVEKLAEDTAGWDRTKGREKMAAFLASQGDRIEAVFSNNDDMALGAIDALKGWGYFKDNKYIPVVGVDATTDAIKAMEDGTLLGTVLNDAKNQGKALFNLAQVLANKQTLNKENIGGYELTDGKYIWTAYKKITKDNLNDAR